MKRFNLLVIVATLPVWAMGCSMCCGPFDYDYPAYGGLVTRNDPVNGRVGSILSDPMASFGGAGADSNLTPPPELQSSSGSGGVDDGSDIDIDDIPDATEPGNRKDLPEVQGIDNTAVKQTQRIRRGGRVANAQR